MATESYGRCDDGVHWIIYHELPLGQWWWMVRPEGGERIDSPQRYPTEGQALAAVVAARATVVACRALTETMTSLRARAEAAEARAAQAEADARLMAGLAFASFVARTSFSFDIVEAGLLDALEVASDHTAAVSDADLIAAVRRILAAGGAA